MQPFVPVAAKSPQKFELVIDLLVAIATIVLIVEIACLDIVAEYSIVRKHVVPLVLVLAQELNQIELTVSDQLAVFLESQVYRPR